MANSNQQTLNEIHFLKKELAFLRNKEENKKDQIELEKLLSKSQEIAHIGSWSLDLIENKLSWTDEVYRIFGLEPQEITPSYEAFLNAIHPEDRTKVDAAYSTSIKEGKDSYEIEHRIIRNPSQEVRFVLEKCQHIRNKYNEIISSIGMVQDITDKKTIGYTLKQNQEKYKNLFEEIRSGVAIYEAINNGEDFIIKSFNRAGEKMDGVKRDDIFGKNVLEIFPGIKEMGLLDVFKRVWETGKSEDHPISAYKDERLLVWRENHVYKLSTGEIVAIYEDTTQKVKDKEDLEQSELRFRHIADYNYDWEYWIKPNGEYAYISPSCERISGYKAEEFMAKSELFFDIIKPEFRTQIHLHYTHEQESNNDTHQIEFAIIKKNGEECWIEHNCIPVFDDKGNYEGRRGNNRDITLRKKALQEIIIAKNTAQKNEQKQKERVKELNGLYSLELLAERSDIVIDFYNKFIQNIVPESMQYPSKTIVLLRIDDVSYCNKKGVKLIKPKNYLSAKINVFKKQIGELIISYSENLPFIEIYEQRLIDAYALKLSIIIERNKTIQDLKIQNEEYAAINEELISSEEEIKTTNHNLILAKEKAEESDRLKSAFLANMSHEIRTPMNGILGFTSLLKEPNLSSEEMETFSAVIERSGARMLDTINNLIDISKIEAEQVEVHLSTVNINTQIDNLYHFFKVESETKELALSFNKGLPDSKSIITTDDEKIYGALTNLIKNAIKFTREGSVSFGYDLKKNFLEFYIKDTGIGIQKDKQQNIFDRFTQVDLSLSSQYEGSGLGLSITKAYIQMLGGKLWMESKEGVGTTFSFTIPYNTSKGEQTPAEKKPEHRFDSNSSKKINLLIADDDETSRTYLQALAQDKCQTIHFAKDGKEAVAICKKDTDIDLILMDIKMPEMNGYEATKRIRAFNKDVIIIAQTAYALNGDREKALKAKCNDYITKPIAKKDFMELLNNHFPV